MDAASGVTFIRVALGGLLGGGDLFADLRERRGQRVVDAALGLLDRVRRGPRPLALAAARAPLACAGRRGRGGLRCGPGRRLLGLLEAQSQAMALRVERDDLQLEVLALVNDIARMGDALVGQLADVDQALETIADADEGAEVDELRDRSVDDVADLEVGHGRVPRVRLETADRQADPAALVIDVDDLGLDLVADLVAGLGVVDLVPAELALVDQAVDPAEVDEDAERRDRADGAGDLLADLEAAEQLVALLAALLVEGDLLREDEPVRLAVDLEDLEPELAPDERLELLGDLLGGIARLVVLRPAREVDDLADRHEAADPAVDDQAALVVVDDRRLDDDARLELLLHRAPLPLEAGATEREDGVALLRLRLEDVDEDGVADRELGLRLGMPPVELAVADDAFALGADVDEDLVLVDPDDLALDDVAVLEALDVRVLLGEELLHRGRLGAEVARRRRRLVSGSSSSAAAGASAKSASASATAAASAARDASASAVERDVGGVASPQQAARRRDHLGDGAAAGCVLGRGGSAVGRDLGLRSSRSRIWRGSLSTSVGR